MFDYRKLHIITESNITEVDENQLEDRLDRDALLLYAMLNCQNDNSDTLAEKAKVFFNLLRKSTSETDKIVKRSNSYFKQLFWTLCKMSTIDCFQAAKQLGNIDEPYNIYATDFSEG